MQIRRAKTPRRARKNADSDIESLCFPKPFQDQFAVVTPFQDLTYLSLRIARPRNALWRAILRRAILNISFIRIARPIYLVFICVDMPFKTTYVLLRVVCIISAQNFDNALIDSIPKLINIDFDKIQRHEVFYFSPSFIYAVNLFLMM